MAEAEVEVDFLVLGAGWTSTFLLPLLRSSNITHAATTTTGREGTIPFTFDPDSDDRGPYTRLPRAKTVLITFPLKGRGPARTLTTLYSQTHAAMTTNWIQLGSTGVFMNDGWNDHDSECDGSNRRAAAEDELLELNGCVLNLAGLYDGTTRQPKNWVARVAKTKDQLRSKKALHLIHGEDVARAVLAVHRHFSTDRWLITDLHVYDWWDLVYDWGAELTAKWEGENESQRPQYRKWVLELMDEENVRALPRGPESLGRVLDSRHFWKSMGIWPSQGRVT